MVKRRHCLEDRIALLHVLIRWGAQALQQSIFLQDRENATEDTAANVLLGVPRLRLCREELDEPALRVDEEVPEKETRILSVLNGHRILFQEVLEEFQQDHESQTLVTGPEVEHVTVCFRDRFVVPLILVETSTFGIHEQMPAEVGFPETGELTPMSAQEEIQILVIGTVEVGRLDQDVEDRPNPVRVLRSEFG